MFVYLLCFAKHLHKQQRSSFKIKPTLGLEKKKKLAWHDPSLRKPQDPKCDLSDFSAAQLLKTTVSVLPGLLLMKAVTVLKSFIGC